MPHNIFTQNLHSPVVAFKPLQPDTRIDEAPQLAYCLSLLQSVVDPDETLDQAAYKWLQITKDDADEKERLRTLATDVIRAFKRDELKDAKSHRRGRTPGSCSRDRQLSVSRQRVLLWNRTIWITGHSSTRRTRSVDTGC